MSAAPRIWVEGREECWRCGGSGEGGPQGPQDGAKQTKHPGRLCPDCDGEGSLAVEVELAGLAENKLRIRRPA